MFLSDVPDKILPISLSLCVKIIRILYFQSVINSIECPVFMNDTEEHGTFSLLSPLHFLMLDFQLLSADVMSPPNTASPRQSHFWGTVLVAIF